MKSLSVLMTNRYQLKVFIYAITIIQILMRNSRKLHSKITKQKKQKRNIWMQTHMRVVGIHFFMMKMKVNKWILMIIKRWRDKIIGWRPHRVVLLTWNNMLISVKKIISMCVIVTLREYRRESMKKRSNVKDALTYLSIKYATIWRRKKFHARSKTITSIKRYKINHINLLTWNYLHVVKYCK